MMIKRKRNSKKKEVIERNGGGRGSWVDISCSYFFIYCREQVKEQDRVQLWKKLDELKLSFDSKKSSSLVPAK